MEYIYKKAAHLYIYMIYCWMDGEGQWRFLWWCVEMVMLLERLCTIVEELLENGTGSHRLEREKKIKRSNSFHFLMFFPFKTIHHFVHIQYKREKTLYDTRQIPHSQQHHRFYFYSIFFYYWFHLYKRIKHIKRVTITIKYPMLLLSKCLLSVVHGLYCLELLTSSLYGRVIMSLNKSYKEIPNKSQYIILKLSPCWRDEVNPSSTANSDNK